MKHLIALIIIIILPQTIANLQINEISYTQNEWIEIFNEGNHTINLSQWQISDNKQTDTIQCCQKNCSLQLPPHNYTIIIGKSSIQFNTTSSMVCVDDSKIGNGLGDLQDSITLTTKNISITTNYTKTQGAYKNNKTLERRIDGTWGESLTEWGTPLTQNSIWLLSTKYSVIKITEFLPNPKTTTKTKPFGEWVEIYNSANQAIAVHGLKITDSKSTNELYIADNNILGNATLCGHCFLTIYKNGDSDFSLNNNGYDEVKLLFDGELIDSVSYTGSTPGMSWSKINENWYQTPPTPSANNQYIENCDWSLSITTANDIQKTGLDFTITATRNYGFASNITVRGIIQNNNGQTLKQYAPWTNTLTTTKTSKKYSPNLPEGIYQISFSLQNQTCNDNNQENNVVKKIFSTNPYYQKNQNQIQIEKLYLNQNNSIKWGSQLRLKVQIYKGNSTKNVIQIWAEKDGTRITKQSKIALEDNFKNYAVTIPLQLIPNCAHELLEDGEATIIVEGLNQQQQQRFYIMGLDKTLCKDYASYIQKNERELIKEKKQQSLLIQNLPAELNAGQAYRFQLQIFEDKEQDYIAWSYLFRGSKCYSCNSSSKEDNKVQFTVDTNQLRQIDLLNKIDQNLVSGLYTMMVKLQKKDHKTAKRITQKLYIKGENKTISKIKTNTSSLINQSQNESLNLLVKLKIENQTTMSKRTIVPESKFVVYQSSNNKQLIPIFLCLTFAVMLIFYRKP